MRSHNRWNMYGGDAMRYVAWKNVGWNYAAYPWLVWDTVEQKTVAYCSEATAKEYAEQLNTLGYIQAP